MLDEHFDVSVGHLAASQVSFASDAAQPAPSQVPLERLSSCRRRLHAFDARTGEELWSTVLPGQVNANPLTYRGRSGKQYVAAVATDTLMAFALP